MKFIRAGLFLGLFASVPLAAQDRGYPISRKDGPLHKTEVVALFKAKGQGTCTSSEWRALFNVSCQQLFEMFKTVDQTSDLTQLSQLPGYIESLTEAACPKGVAQVATVRKGPSNPNGVVDYHYRRPFGRDEKCLYNRNNSVSGVPIVPIDCWNGVRGYRTNEELAQLVDPPKPVKEIVERTSTDTLRLSVSNSSVYANGYGSLREGQAFPIQAYGFLRYTDLRNPIKPDTAWLDRPVPGPSQPAWKSKKFWVFLVLGSAIAGYVGHELGQQNVKCLACTQK